jgi:DNA-binding response OmpR family regulator
MRLNGHYILSIEDDPNDALFLRLALESVGLGDNLMTVSTGWQALEYLSGVGEYGDRERFPLPHIVLLDLYLPHVMGFEVLRWMRTRKEFASMIVVPLSSSGELKDRAEAKELAVNGYLVKPLNLAGWRNLARGLKEAWFCEELVASGAAVRAGETAHV